LTGLTGSPHHLSEIHIGAHSCQRIQKESSSEIYGVL
jgi:hypothetical protein